MIHEIDVSNLMFNKTSNEEINFKKYDINVDLEEDFSNDEKTVLKYSLDLTSNPKNAVINISGNTILSGEKSEIEKYLKQEDEKTPEVVSLIYQELFPLMYIISKNMKIPSPAHTISQNNIGEATQHTEKQDTINEKPLDSQPTDKTNEVNDTNESVDRLQETEIKNNTEPDVKEEQNNKDKT